MKTDEELEQEIVEKRRAEFLAGFADDPEAGERWWKKIAYLEELSAWEQVRKDKRWFDDHPYAVKEFLDAIRTLHKSAEALPKPPAGADPKTIKRLKRSLTTTIEKLEAYIKILEDIP